MISRNRRGRPANMKARFGIAAAVLAGGGAIAVAVAASGHGTADSAATAGFSYHARHYDGDHGSGGGRQQMMSEGYALSSALSQWQWSQDTSLSTLSQMAPVTTFSQQWHNGTQFAAQRGVVELATPKFLLVRSANGKLELWWLGHTRTDNVSASLTGLTVLTGSRAEAIDLLVHDNVTPAATTMAGSTSTVSSLIAPAAPATTVSVTTGSATVTVTITSSSATVSAPRTTPATTAGASLTSASAGTTASGPMVTATQPAFARAGGIQRGDLVFLAGVREHGFLVAKLALFAPLSATMTSSGTMAPALGVTPATGATPAATATPAAGSTPVQSTTINGQPAEFGDHT
jgi:hypothetical protein